MEQGGVRYEKVRADAYLLPTLIHRPVLFGDAGESAAMVAQEGRRVREGGYQGVHGLLKVDLVEVEDAGHQPAVGTDLDPRARL